MPFRNAFPYLKECLESIINQSYSNWELIAVNDHSEDKSNALILEYAAMDQRIHCIQNKGKGIIDALNSGYALSKGDFVTRMDADDVMPSQKLEELLSLLLESGVGFVSTGKVKYISETSLGDGFIKYENWLNRLCDEARHYSEIYKECVIPSPCWMTHRSDFESIGAFDSETYPEDYDLCFRMYEHKIRVVSSDQVLHIWRDHGQRASRNDDNYSDNRFIDLKVKYFLRNDLDSNKKLVVWGAGKKGKQIAQLLISNDIQFEWITNNEKKIGKHIYDHLIKDSSHIHDLDKFSVILAVANEKDQTEIIKSIDSIDREVQLYPFC